MNQTFDFDSLARLFATHGSGHYDELVTLTQHMLQAADSARQAGADDELVVAALLHDVGYLLLAENGDAAAFRDHDLGHEHLGENYLRPLFGDRVATVAGLHVDAKRFLCAVDPAYYEQLSPASVNTLRLQGGPFTKEQAAEFIGGPHAHDALALRRWDEAAKDANRVTPTLADYQPLLQRLAN